MGNAGEPYWKFRKPKSDSKTIVNPVETDEFDSSKTWYAVAMAK